MEFDAAAADGDIPALQVDLVVVGAAEQAAILNGGHAAVDPVPAMMDLTKPGWPITAGKGASAIPGHQGPANANRDAALGAADVEWFGIPAEHHRDQLSVAG